MTIKNLGNIFLNGSNNNSPRPHLWNQRIEGVVKEIEDQSKQYKKVHSEKAQHFRTLYNRYMGIAVFMGPLTTTISGLGMLIFPEESFILTVTTTILTFVSGLIFSYVKYNKIEELSLSHNLASLRYTSLEKNIHRQLLLYKSDRISPQQYLEWLSTTFDELLITSPYIDDEELMWSHLNTDNG